MADSNPDKIAKKIISDPVDFKLTVARHYLHKIPDKMPNQDLDYFLFEVNVDAFLFFCSSTIDIVKREINEKFKLFDKENVFYIHGVRKKLADSGEQKKTKQIIANYFTTPVHSKTTKSGWDTKQSSLWRLQILRNQVAHGNVLRKTKDGKALSFVYTIREYKKQGKPPYLLKEIAKNPEKYFEEIFDDLCEFVKKTRKITIPKAQSQYHKKRIFDIIPD
jgi:hypothetical protein